MKKFPSIKAALCAAVLFTASSSLFAADAKTYQVTGPVLNLTPTTITVQKGDDKWEIAAARAQKSPVILKSGPRSPFITR